MTRRQYRTILWAMAALLLVWLALGFVFLRSSQVSCQRGNVTRAHIARPAPLAECGLFSGLTGS